MVIHYIGADVHCNNTELCIERNGRIVARHSLKTAAEAIRRVLDGLGGQKHLTFEEGPLASWLYRSLKDQVDTLIVCDPRQNKLIAAGGDKDDRIDAAKLARLLRGGYLHPVYHSDDLERITLKRWVALYHDRVKEATRSINKVRACCRLYGDRVPRRALRDPAVRAAWLAGLESDLADQVRLLWMDYDSHARQVRQARAQLVRRAQAYPIIGYWSALPGVGLIRATTLFAYLDTPWRFQRKNQIWKYCGLGLQRCSSGQDRHGRARPARLQLVWPRNARLKNVVVGMALSAIRSRDNLSI